MRLSHVTCEMTRQTRPLNHACTWSGLPRISLSPCPLTSIPALFLARHCVHRRFMAALETARQFTDNPLFEGSHQDECVKQRFAAPRLSLEESHFKPVTRRGSLSLSAKDYEGIWRAVQEDVSKTSNESKSPLEDFNEFRQKLALLKQDMTGPTGGRSGFTSTGSTRSLNISPSRPTSPLKRLSVITSRKTAATSGLNPQPRVSPTVQKIAVTMRAEGLFKLPSPASISPVPLSDAFHPATPSFASSTTPTKRRFSVSSYRAHQFRQKSVDMTASAEALRTDFKFKSGEIPEGREVPETPKVLEIRVGSDGHSREAEELNAGSANHRGDQSKKFGGVPLPVQVQTQASSEIRGEHSKKWGSASSTAIERKSSSHSTTSSIRRLTVPCGGPKAPKIQTQQAGVKKSGGFSTRDWKVRCIPIPRPVCYSANILD